MLIKTTILISIFIITLALMASSFRPFYEVRQVHHRQKNQLPWAENPRLQEKVRDDLEPFLDGSANVQIKGNPGFSACAFDSRLVMADPRLVV